MFTLEKTTTHGRRGVIHTAHGDVPTPVFMPVATAGAMKGITFADLEALSADILLCNTYHLHLTPGEEIVEKAGGLHSFIGWKKPILTDSGGFQVFSLEAIRTITDDGVEFKDHRNGDTRFIGPKEAMQIQHALGADIIMCFDECPPSTAPRAAQ
ncbi:MAG: tRNA-guanine transglycosylase, partial [Candidatus Peribacteraceae bacterium]|nr:tRNA-guanine transglycosylase [Candidatus Peribacteraceae bacterium]MBP9851017.1 tRNA-guanine transglycosylase [Candidatus Peribacteraceae bacterium]